MKKRVLIFIPEFPSLTETFIAREVNKLVESPNLDITVVSKVKGEGSISEKTKQLTHYESSSIVSILSSLRFLITNPEQVLKAIFTVGPLNLYIFLQGMAYAHIFSKYNPQVIYAHFLSKHSSIALVASIILKTELAISAHARDILEYPHLPAQKARYAKFIAICNKNACEKAIELSKIQNPDNIKLVYHGVDPKDLETSEEITMPEVPLIFTVGRYVEKKGLNHLIEASLSLKSKGIKHKVVIVGGGELHPDLKEMVKSLGLEDYVELPGAMSFEKIKTYYKMASVYAQPSINVDSGDADGIPNTLIEAAMNKLSIVTTDAGSIAEFLDDTSAVIIPQRNSEGLAEGIKLLLENKQLSTQLGNNAFLKAKQMFDTETNIKEIEDMLLVEKRSN